MSRIRQHMAAEHTSAYVSIRQHTSALLQSLPQVLFRQRLSHQHARPAAAGASLRERCQCLFKHISAYQGLKEALEEEERCVLSC